MVVVDARGGDFIQWFREQLRLQRLDSIMCLDSILLVQGAGSAGGRRR